MKTAMRNSSIDGIVDSLEGSMESLVAAKFTVMEASDVSMVISSAVV